MHEHGEIMNMIVAGRAGLDVQDGTFKQEPGSGVCGQVQGCTVAVGNLDWVRSHSQIDAATADSPPSSSGSGTSIDQDTFADGTQIRSHHASLDSRSSSGSSASSSSLSGGSQDSSGPVTGNRTRRSVASRADGEGASTSGRSEANDAGIMRVYVGVNGKLAGVFEMKDQLRPHAAATIRGLQRHGIDTILLSGTLLSPSSLRMLWYAVLCCAAFCCCTLALCCLVT